MSEPRNVGHWYCAQRTDGPWMVLEITGRGPRPGMLAARVVAAEVPEAVARALCEQRNEGRPKS